MATASIGTTRKNKARLAYKPSNKRNAKYPIHRLPFIGSRNGTGLRIEIPDVDGYGTGCDFGAAAGCAYLKALRETKDQTGGYLQHLILELLGNEPANEEESGLRGFMVGFFSELDSVLSSAARSQACSALDSISKDDLLKQMQRALDETEHDHSMRFQHFIEFKEQLQQHSVLRSSLAV